MKSRNTRLLANQECLLKKALPLTGKDARYFKAAPSHKNLCWQTVRRIKKKREEISISHTGTQRDIIVPASVRLLLMCFHCLYLSSFIFFLFGTKAVHLSYVQILTHMSTRAYNFATHVRTPFVFTTSAQPTIGTAE